MCVHRLFIFSSDMKRFVTRLVLFCALLYASLAVLDISVSSRFWKSRDFVYAAWNDILKGNMANDIVIMGSSRAWTQYSPFVLDSIMGTTTYNLGCDGSNVSRQIPRYYVYRANNAKPKLVIQNIDWNGTMEYGNQYLRKQFFPYFYNKSMRDYALDYEDFDLADKYFPLYRYNYFMNIACAIKSADSVYVIPKKNYYGWDLQWNGENFNNVDTIKFMVDERSANMFREYLSHCKKDSVQVVFVYAPIYIGATQKVANLPEVYSTYKSFADEFDIPILDYTYSYISQDTSYFYNATHLNKTGSTEFSAMLANDLEKLIWPLVNK